MTKWLADIFPIRYRQYGCKYSNIIMEKYSNKAANRNVIFFRPKTSQPLASGQLCMMNCRCEIFSLAKMGLLKHRLTNHNSTNYTSHDSISIWNNFVSANRSQSEHANAREKWAAALLSCQMSIVALPKLCTEPTKLPYMHWKLCTRNCGISSEAAQLHWIVQWICWPSCHINRVDLFAHFWQPFMVRSSTAALVYAINIYVLNRLGSF